ncbi:MAG: hypothetical protein D3917_01390 [Candidatus Electrothrix sp. AX5]|nr:hypothetical protein [Candidatus Electrothrix sp. AX5]
MLIPDSSGTHNATSKVPACTKKKYMQAFSSGACRHPLPEHAGILFRNMQACSANVTCCTGAQAGAWEPGEIEPIPALKDRAIFGSPSGTLLPCRPEGAGR